jgi:hypothetical protein
MIREMGDTGVGVISSGGSDYDYGGFQFQPLVLLALAKI